MENGMKGAPESGKPVGSPDGGGTAEEAAGGAALRAAREINLDRVTAGATGASNVAPPPEEIKFSSWLSGNIDLAEQMKTMPRSQLIDMINGVGGLRTDLSQLRNFLALNSGAGEESTSTQAQWNQVFQVEKKLGSLIPKLENIQEYRAKNEDWSAKLLRTISFGFLDSGFSKEQTAFSNLDKEFKELPLAIQTLGKRWEVELSELNQYMGTLGVNKNTSRNGFDFAENNRLKNLHKVLFGVLRDAIYQGISQQDLKHFLDECKAELSAAKNGKPSPNNLPDASDDKKTFELRTSIEKLLTGHVERKATRKAAADAEAVALRHRGTVTILQGRVSEAEGNQAAKAREDAATIADLQGKLKASEEATRCLQASSADSAAAARAAAERADASDKTREEAVDKQRRAEADAAAMRDERDAALEAQKQMAVRAMARSAERMRRGAMARGFQKWKSGAVDARVEEHVQSRVATADARASEADNRARRAEEEKDRIVRETIADMAQQQKLLESLTAQLAAVKSALGSDDDDMFETTTAQGKGSSAAGKPRTIASEVGKLKSSEFVQAARVIQGQVRRMALERKLGEVQNQLVNMTREATEQKEGAGQLRREKSGLKRTQRKTDRKLEELPRQAAEITTLSKQVKSLQEELDKKTRRTEALAGVARAKVREAKEAMGSVASGVEAQRAAALRGLENGAKRREKDMLRAGFNQFRRATDAVGAQIDKARLVSEHNAEISALQFKLQEAAAEAESGIVTLAKAQQQIKAKQDAKKKIAKDLAQSKKDQELARAMAAQAEAAYGEATRAASRASEADQTALRAKLEAAKSSMAQKSAAFSKLQAKSTEAATTAARELNEAHAAGHLFALDNAAKAGEVAKLRKKFAEYLRANQEKFTDGQVRKAELEAQVSALQAELLEAEGALDFGIEKVDVVGASPVGRGSPARVIQGKRRQQNLEGQIAAVEKKYHDLVNASADTTAWRILGGKTAEEGEGERQVQKAIAKLGQQVNKMKAALRARGEDLKIAERRAGAAEEKVSRSKETHAALASVMGLQADRSKILQNQSGMAAEDAASSRLERKDAEAETSRVTVAAEKSMAQQQELLESLTAQLAAVKSALGSDDDDLFAVEDVTNVGSSASAGADVSAKIRGQKAERERLQKQVQSLEKELSGAQRAARGKGAAERTSAKLFRILSNIQPKVEALNAEVLRMKDAIPQAEAAARGQIVHATAAGLASSIVKEAAGNVALTKEAEKIAEVTNQSGMAAEDATSSRLERKDAEARADEAERRALLATSVGKWRSLVASAQARQTIKAAKASFEDQVRSARASDEEGLRAYKEEYYLKATEAVEKAQRALKAVADLRAEKDTAVAAASAAKQEAEASRREHRDRVGVERLADVASATKHLQRENNALSKTLESLQVGLAEEIHNLEVRTGTKNEGGYPQGTVEELSAALKAYEEKFRPKPMEESDDDAELARLEEELGISDGATNPDASISGTGKDDTWEQLQTLRGQYAALQTELKETKAAGLTAQGEAAAKGMARGMVGAAVAGFQAKMKPRAVATKKTEPIRELSPEEASNRDVFLEAINRNRDVGFLKALATQANDLGDGKQVINRDLSTESNATYLRLVIETRVSGGHGHAPDPQFVQTHLEDVLKHASSTPAGGAGANSEGPHTRRARQVAEDVEAELKK